MAPKRPLFRQGSGKRQPTQTGSGANRAIAIVKVYSGLERVHKFQDRARREVEGFVQGPICIEGCGQCCTHTVPFASRLEASYLVSTTAPADLAVIKRRCFDWLKDTENQADLPEVDLPFGTTGQNMTAAQQQAYHDSIMGLATTPCPMLLTGALCGVYNNRPMVCRAYGATLPANSWCPRPLSPHETSENRWVIGKGTTLGHMLTGAVDGMFQATHAQGIDEQRIFGLFPSLLCEILDPDEYKRLAQSGGIHPAKFARSVRPTLDMFAGSNA